MICDFTSFSTVFQSYKDDGQIIYLFIQNFTTSIYIHTYIKYTYIHNIYIHSHTCHRIGL